MFDDLRKESQDSPYFQQAAPPAEEETPVRPLRRPTSKKMRFNLMPGGKFLGLSPVQQFILSLLLFLMVCSSGFFVLVITEKIVFF